MRIARVEVFEYWRALDGRYWNPAWRWHERRAPLVRITAADGLAGLGEAWSDQTRIGDVFNQAGVIAPRLLDRDARNIAAIAADLWPADGPVAAAVASAYDMALWDLCARRMNVPLRLALGAMAHDVAVYASGGLYADDKDAASLATEMAGYARRGFTAFKMKIGALGITADLDRVRAARGAIGPDGELMVDAVGCLPRDMARSWLSELHALGVRAIQAPLPAADVDGMVALQQTGLLDVVALETEYRAEAFQVLLDRGAVGWLQFNPALAGGMTHALALIAKAQDSGVPVTLQCHGTAVLQAACLQLAARSGVRSAEFHMFHDHLHDILPPSMTTVHKGYLKLGEEVGIGIDPDSLDRGLVGPGRLTRMLALPD